MNFVEHKSPTFLLEAFKGAVGPTSSLDLPKPRIIGFVDIGGETYHHIALGNCRGHPAQTRDLDLPRQRAAFFGSAEVPPDQLDAIISKLSPPTLVISRKEFNRGMKASGLPDWVVESLTRDAEKSGLFDAF